MRLIDADELIDVVDKAFYTTEIHSLNDLDYGFNNGLDKAIEIVANQPTAYNIDKIVKELRKEAIGKGGVLYVTRAIEIVKGEMKND